MMDRIYMKFYILFPVLVLQAFSLFGESVSAWTGLETARREAVAGENSAIPPGAGLTVLALPENGPLTEGLRVGDILFRFGEQILVHPDQLQVLLTLVDPAEMIPVVYFRSGEEQEVVLPVLWETPPVPVVRVSGPVVTPMTGIPMERAVRGDATDPLAEREAAVLNRIRKQADEKLNFGGIVAPETLRRSGEAADE